MWSASREGGIHFGWLPLVVSVECQTVLAARSQIICIWIQKKKKKEKKGICLCVDLCIFLLCFWLYEPKIMYEPNTVRCVYVCFCVYFVV
jgi:hypothetical protein